MLTPGFTKDGKLVFRFDQEILIPEELKTIELRTEALSPISTDSVNTTTTDRRL